MTYALIGFAIMLILMLTGLPIGFAMLAVGFVGYALMTNWDAAFGLLSLVPFDQVAVYSMSVIPLFCLMGEFGFRSGVVSDAYGAADKWVGHHRGGLCMATNVACAAFAAMTGSSIAGSSIMTQVAWPEMKKSATPRAATPCSRTACWPRAPTYRKSSCWTSRPTRS